MSLVNRELGPEGALVDIEIAVHPARRYVLRRLGLPVPTPRIIKGQIDTGASNSGIHRAVLQELELYGEVDCVEIRTASTEEVLHPTDVYLCDLTLCSAEGNRTFPSLLVLAHTFGPEEEARALIGRDILASCHLEWDGPRQRFVFTF